MPKFTTRLAANALALWMAAGCTVLAITATPAAAAEAGLVQPSAAFNQRAQDLILMINGEKDPKDIFSPGFLEQASAERLVKFSEAVRTKHGQALAVNRVEAVTPERGTVHIDFEKRQFPVQIQIHPEAPHLIGGMHIGE